MSYRVQVLDDGTLPAGHQWAVGQYGKAGHNGDVIAFVERSAVQPETFAQCWAAYSLLTARAACA